MQEGLEICSFCNKHKDSVQKLIVSDRVAICNECVDLCQELLSDSNARPDTDIDKKDPKKLKEFIDQYVISQEHAKMVLSVAVINHYKRLNNQDVSV